jgi:hypothetical protein
MASSNASTVGLPRSANPHCRSPALSTISGLPSSSTMLTRASLSSKA